MTNVSKATLTAKEEIALFIQLTRLFSEKSNAETHGILNDLLGYEEKLMLAKRFAIIALLWKKQSLYSIAQKLHVSTSTVARIEINYHQGRYENIVLLFKKPTLSIINILNTIDDILHLGGILPHYGETHRSEAFKKARELRLRRNH